MNDPRRLADEDALSRLLIGSAADDAPSPEGRASARRATLAAAAMGVGAGVSVGLVTSGAQAATKTAGWVAMKWLAIAVSPIAIASVAYVGIRVAEPVRAVPPAPRTVTAVSSGSGAQPLAPIIATPTLAEAPSPAPSGKGATAEGRARAPAPSLESEITELDAARHALARGDSSVLDRYLATHPRGALREQAIWMKVTSLEQAGRNSEARAWAKRLLASYPNGAFSARARAMIQQ